ncbi:hypothetical protein DM790_22650 [Flavobacterium collinsii]|nr:hypothetical protein [Flavobacterium collinsii]
MYDKLISFGNEIEPRLREHFPSDSYCGVSIDLDQFWETTEMIDLLAKNRIAYYDWFYLHERYWETHLFWDYIRYQYSRERFFLSGDINLYSKNKYWDKYCKDLGYPENLSPVIIRVKPKSNMDSKKEEFINIGYQNFRVIYEKNDPVKFIKGNFLNRIKSYFLRKKLLAPSIIIKGWNVGAGTVGGLLIAENSKRIFLVSCAHVMRKTGNLVCNESNRLHPIAKVVHTSIPEITDSTTPCNCNSNPELYGVDIALAEIDVRIDQIENIHKLECPTYISSISELSPYTKVSFIGKSSGRVEARLGPLTIWHKINSNEGSRCFGRIFQLFPLHNQYTVEPLAKPGDSGAWILIDDGLNRKWCGVVIAAENGIAYGCFAETAIDNVKAKLQEQVVIYQNNV